jgi:hypothetical protein
MLTALFVVAVPLVTVCVFLVVEDRPWALKSRREAWKEAGFVGDERNLEARRGGRALRLQVLNDRSVLGVALHAPQEGWQPSCHTSGSVETVIQRALVGADSMDDGGGWRQVRDLYGLKVELEEGFRVLRGQTVFGPIEALQGDHEVHIELRLGSDARAVPGSGNSGNAVLDLFIDSSDVPDQATGALLELIREHPGSRLQNGCLVVHTTEPLPDAMLRTMDIAQLLQSGSAPGVNAS